jgi:glyoxylase-like metal-dependent hydrolase (beta-lactamase superfamily II)
MSPMIHLVDALHLGAPNVICIALLEAGNGELVMIDSGPENVFASVVEGIKKIGFLPEQVRHLFLTHIHLDHSGGAWRWAKEFGTHIYAHPIGCPHLVDPSKLVSSATRIYTDKMEYLWGKIEGIAPELVTEVDDHAESKIGQLSVRVLYTPGHANHHNAYQVGEKLFTGDVAGCRIGRGAPVPPFVPPEASIELWKDSLDKLRAAHPGSLYLTHFGKVDDPAAHIDALEDRIFRWSDWMRQKLVQGKSEKELVPEFQALSHKELVESGATQEDMAAYERGNPSAMSVLGLARYWRKVHPEMLIDKPA